MSGTFSDPVPLVEVMVPLKSQEGLLSLSHTAKVLPRKFSLNCKQLELLRFISCLAEPLGTTVQLALPPDELLELDEELDDELEDELLELEDELEDPVPGLPFIPMRVVDTIKSS